MAKNLKLRLQTLSEWMAENKFPKKRKVIVEPSKESEDEK